jgi:ribosomal protein S27AE
MKPMVPLSWHFIVDVITSYIDGGDMARPFGADDRPACVKCGRPTHLSRRSPSPDNEKLELQTFTCPNCGHEQGRVADFKGDVDKI